ncbi:hypothetical protein [Trichothermofontia sp.]
MITPKIRVLSVHKRQCSQNDYALPIALFLPTHPSDRGHSHRPECDRTFGQR